MSGLEKHVLHIIEKYELPYRFVGNGDFYIERKNPDFVNTNGEKKVVEVYWQRHKDLLRSGGFQKWHDERVEIFGSYGWEVIFLEGSGINEEKVLDALRPTH